jgi:hypothetical protein
MGRLTKAIWLLLFAASCHDGSSSDGVPIYSACDLEHNCTGGRFPSGCQRLVLDPLPDGGVVERSMCILTCTDDSSCGVAYCMGFDPFTDTFDPDSSTRVCIPECRTHCEGGCQSVAYGAETRDVCIPAAPAEWGE